MTWNRARIGIASFSIVLLALFVAVQPTSAQSASSASRVELPRPSGAYPVGTVTMRLMDSTRATSRRIPQRSLAVQVWYPARSTAGKRARYLVEPGLLDSMVNRKYLDLDSTAIRAWARIETQSSDGAVPRNPASSAGWPVIVLSHGMGVARASYSSFGQELASRGHVVVAIDHPISGFALDEHGRLLTPGVDTLHYASAPIVSVVRDMALDAGLIARKVRGMLDALRTTRAIRLDPASVAMVGHSLGGAAALEACRIDAIFKACVNMDGDPFGDAETEKTGKPILVLLSQPDRRNDAPPRDSAEAARRERFLQMGRERDSMWTGICARNGSVPCSFLKLRGTGHMSFTDAPFVAPSLLLGVGATEGPNLAFATIIGHLTGFLRTHLNR